MVEILGAELDKAFVDLGINAIKTYQSTSTEKYQVWEINELDFSKIDNIKEEDWKDDWGWWRFSIGSTMFGPTAEISINGESIEAWYDENERDSFIEAYACDYPYLSGEDAYEKAEEDFFEELVFPDLLTYYCDHLSISTETNVAALSVDLARMNNMKLSELFQKCQV